MWYTLCNLLYLKPFTRNLRLIIILLLLFSWLTRRLDLRKLQLAWAYIVRFELRSSCLQSQRSNFPLNELPVPIIPLHFLHASNVPGAFQLPSPSIFVLDHPLVHTASPPSLLRFHIKYASWCLWCEALEVNSVVLIAYTIHSGRDSPWKHGGMSSLSPWERELFIMCGKSHTSWAETCSSYCSVHIHWIPTWGSVPMSSWYVVCAFSLHCIVSLLP